MTREKGMHSKRCGSVNMDFLKKLTDKRYDGPDAASEYNPTILAPIIFIPRHVMSVKFTKDSRKSNN